MKKVFVLGVQPDPEGPTFGRVMNPEDFQKSQDFAHGHIDQVVKDLLVAGAQSAQVAGFGATVAGGLSVSVAVGSAVDALGVSYESADAATVVVMAPAHQTLARIDLIYASLELDAAAQLEFRPFRQLRTPAELEAGTPAYLPEQFNQPTELHTRATIAVKTGVAGANPVAPAVGANEVALWQVHVAAGQVTIVANDLTSVRVLMKSLYQVMLDVNTLVAQMAVLGETVQDIVGVFIISPDGSLTVNHNDVGNVFSIQLAAAYKALLDGATYLNPAGTEATLVKRAAAGFVELGPVDAFGASLLNDGQTQIVLSVKPQPKGSFSNGAGFQVRAIGGPGAGANRCGARLEIIGDLNGAVKSAFFDYFTTLSQQRGLWRMANGVTWYADEAVAGGNGRAHVFRSFDQAAAGFAGPNALLVGQSPSGVDTFYVYILDGSIKTFGNLEVMGNVSKGSGTFLIDHPLHPDTKDLHHSFVESPHDDLIYSGEATLLAGQTQIAVDIDTASGMESGTFAALTQNARVHSVMCKTGFTRAYGTLAGGVLTITAEAATAETFTWLVIAERHDAYIRNAPGHDVDGHLLVERNKPALPANVAELLADTIEVRLADEPAADVVEQRAVSQLVGSQGYPRHAEVIGVGAVPTRNVTIRTQVEVSLPVEEFPVL